MRRVGRLPRVVCREVAFLKRVFNVAIDNEVVEGNPVRQVKLIKENNAPCALPQRQRGGEVTLRSGRSWHVVELALNTRLRRAELFNLQWEHVDFNINLLTIPSTKGEAAAGSHEFARARHPSRAAKPAEGSGAAVAETPDKP